MDARSNWRKEIRLDAKIYIIAFEHRRRRIPEVENNLIFHAIRSP